MSDTPRSESTEPSNEIYDVEKIVGKRTTWVRTNNSSDILKSTEYLVKWSNYDESENTWEPTKNLHHCWKSVSKFEQDLSDYSWNIFETDSIPPTSETVEESEEEVMDVEWYPGQSLENTNNSPRSNASDDDIDEEATEEDNQDDQDHPTMYLP